MPAQGISKQGPERPPVFCPDLVGRCFSHRQELCVGTYTRVDEAVPAKGPLHQLTSRGNISSSGLKSAVKPGRGGEWDSSVLGDVLGTCNSASVTRCT